MGKNIVPSVLVVFVLLVIVCLILFVLERHPGNSAYRELRKQEIRPTLKRITGRGLPTKVENLRAILFVYNGLEDLGVAFQTDQEGCSYILDEFGGENVLMEEFPDVKSQPFEWDFAGFDQAYGFQKKLGVVLFDKNLYDRIQLDALEHANTGDYPKDAVSGYYLEFNADSKSVFYRVLIFKEQALVYISAEKLAEGSYRR